ncbi:MAG: DUF3343 domain-containing protein [Clostridia bacterium]|nr:DUF3343 domain-containing protein [Clostridia bacterium]
MADIIYVFRSRNETMAFADVLKRSGIRNTVVNTPRECMSGCGISVKITMQDMGRVNGIFGAFPYKSTFQGRFSFEKIGIKTKVIKIGN